MNLCRTLSKKIWRTSAGKRSYSVFDSGKKRRRTRQKLNIEFFPKIPVSVGNQTNREMGLCYTPLTVKKEMKFSRDEI
jgi:hypothetical protein